MAMLSVTRLVRRVAAASLVCAAGLATPAGAQDCKLSVSATPGVLTPGQSARIDVAAHFPASDYAFASAQFQVTATAPMWRFVSAGVIAGTNVLGIDVGQPHAPQAGVMADPSNPLRVWTGVYTPLSPAPAFVQFDVLPFGFSVYPSQYTSSSAPCDAVGGREWLFVNPLRVGEFAGAPGPGDTLEVVREDDAERFLVSSQDDDLEIGLLVPAVHKSRAAAAGVSIAGQPNRLMVTTQLRSAQVTYTFADFEDVARQGVYNVRTEFPAGARLRFRFSLRGRAVAELTSEAGLAPFRVDRLPDSFEMSVPPPADPNPRATELSGAVWSGVYDRAGSADPAGANVLFLDGSVRFVDRIQIDATFPRLGPEPLSVGAQSYRATGVRSMTVTPTR
jgi:prepilin-type processing-associated H-X9-DG protein